MSGPLTGYKVIEIAGIGPGPFCAMLLADMGADVIRVDRAQSVRGPAPADPPKDVSLRNRRSVAIDLKHPDGVATLVEVPAMAISSTDCRSRVAAGRPVWYLVPDGVVQYISKRRLYRTG